jgi:hypothetical protein
MNARLTLSLLATTAILAGTPAFAQSRDGTPGNPPSTATGRAVDAVQGQPSQPDGTAGNPPGTAAERAVDRATGSNMSGANPSGSAATDTTQGGTAATTADAAAEARSSLRASRIIGSNIYNEQDESIGEVDDLMLRGEGGPAVAIISVGGFLGIGARNVAVPFPELRYNAERDRWVLPGATKEALRERPAFAYETTRAGAPATGTAAPPRGAMGGGGRPAADPAAPPRQ